jgi:RNA polymerase sigma-70 factor (ECF subfamily)
MTATTDATVEAADAILVSAARGGDLFAWEHLVRRYQEPVYRVAFLIVRDTELAEKAAQSAFVRAWRALPSLEREHGLLPWLFRIAAGEARQQRRDSGRPRHTSRLVEHIKGPHYPATALPALAGAVGLSQVERDRLSEAFDRLGEDDRLTIASRYLFGLSRDDAASALAISAGLLDERLLAALRNLRARMVATG